MKLGDLYVQLKGESAHLDSTFRKSLEEAEKFAKKVKRTLREVGDVGMIAAGAAGAAVALAATVDPAIKREVDNLKHAFEDLAVPVAQMVVPAMRQMAAAVRQVADWIAGLSPHTKEMITKFIEVSAVLGTTAFALSKVALAVRAFAGLMALVTAVPFFAIVAVLAAVAAAAVVLHKAWRENWGGIQEKTKQVIEAMSRYWAEFKDFLGGLFDGIIDGYAQVAMGVIKISTWLAETTGKISKAQGDQLVRDLQFGINAAAQVAKGGGLKTAALNFGATIKDGLMTGAKAFGDEMKSIGTELEAMLGNSGQALRHGYDSFTQAEAIAARGGAMAGGSSWAQATGSSASTTNQAGDLSMISMAELAAAQGRVKSMQDTARFLATGEKIAATQRIQTEQAFVSTLRATLSTIGSELAQAGVKLAGKMGAIGGVISGAIEGFKSGGIIGAVIGIIAEIFSMLQGFTHIVDSLNKFLGMFLNGLDKAVTPFLDTIVSFAEDIGQLIKTTMELTYSFETLGAILRGVAIIIDTVELSFLYVGKGLLAMFGTHDDKLNAMISKIEKDVLQGWNVPTSQIDKLGNAADKAADKFGELLTNMPSGYKLKGAQFAADNGTGGGTGSAAGAAGGPGAAAGKYGDTSDRYGYQNEDQTAFASGSDKENQVDQGQYSESTRPGTGPQAQGATPVIYIENLVVHTPDAAALEKKLQEVRKTRLQQSRRNGERP